MEDKDFLHIYSLINESLVHLVMDRTFNSIGSNVFFEFGKEKEVIHKNGKKQLKKEWSIWISLASWRISKNNRYIVGSGDSQKIIQSRIQTLLGKRFQSLLFLSQFLDAEFNFEDGYQITTFFNWMEEDQWTIFLPDDSNIGVDCSNQTALKNVQCTASHLCIRDHYVKLCTPIEGGVVHKITFNKKNLPVFHFKEKLLAKLRIWRMEIRKGQYLHDRMFR